MGLERGGGHLLGYRHRKEPESIYPKQNEGKIVPQMGTGSSMATDCLFMKKGRLKDDACITMFSSVPTFFSIYQFCQIN